MAEMIGKYKGRECLYKILISFLCACQAMAALTASLLQVKNILDKTVQFNMPLYLIGTVILVLLFLTLTMFTPRPIIASFICLTLLNIIAVINYYEFLYHGTVLTHQDVGNVRTAFHHIGNYKLQLNQPIKFIILSFLVMQLIFVITYRKRINFRSNWREGIAFSVILTVFTYVLIYSPFAVVNSVSWSWERTYYADSFPVGILENAGTVFNNFIKPEGYSENVIAEHHKSDIVESIETKRDSCPDIIIILNETYYDMRHLVDMETDVSFMDHYDELNAYKGYAASPFMCGGTNSSEYELLSGNSMTLLSTSTPFLNLSLNKYPSLVWYLNKLGYATMAAHPFISGNYHRETAWRDLGFHDMYFRSDFKDLESYGGSWYCTDSSAFRNFTDFYEKMPEDQPRFGYLLTIQNHGDWNENDPSYDTVHVGNSYGMSADDCGKMNEYLTRVRLTDEFISEITGYFASVDRDVIVCMVGDHCPSLLYQLKFESAVENGNIQESEEEFTFRKRQVPYFIWSNRVWDYSSMPENSEIDMCALSAYALTFAGLPLSPYFSQLVELSNEAKCITKIDAEHDGDLTIGYLGTDGNIESIYSGTQAADLIRDYFFMEYNSFQNYSRLDELFLP